MKMMFRTTTRKSAHEVVLHLVAIQAPDEALQLVFGLWPGDERHADGHHGVGDEGDDRAPEVGALR
jgi:hypothetical protein